MMILSLFVIQSSLALFLQTLRFFFVEISTSVSHQTILMFLNTTSLRYRMKIFLSLQIQKESCRSREVVRLLIQHAFFNLNKLLVNETTKSSFVMFEKGTFLFNTNYYSIGIVTPTKWFYPYKVISRQSTFVSLITNHIQ